MIARTFPYRTSTTIEVTFDWDNGDPSVGIGPGWGEDTGVIFDAGLLKMYLVFEPLYGRSPFPPAVWPVSSIQVELNGAIVWERTEEHALAEHPAILSAVQEVWKQVRHQERLDRAADDCWCAQDLVFDLEHQLDHELGGDAHRRQEVCSALVRAREGVRMSTLRYDRFKSTYDARYGELVIP